MRSRRAISALGIPSCAHCCACLICVVVSAGLRPVYTPRALARAIPSAWRSLMMERSNSATLPSMPSMSCDMGLVSVV